MDLESIKDSFELEEIEIKLLVKKFKFLIGVFIFVKHHRESLKNHNNLKKLQIQQIILLHYGVLVTKGKVKEN